MANQSRSLFAVCCSMPISQMMMIPTGMLYCSRLLKDKISHNGQTKFLGTVSSITITDISDQMNSKESILEQFFVLYFQQSCELVIQIFTKNGEMTVAR